MESNRKNDTSLQAHRHVEALPLHGGCRLLTATGRLVERNLTVGPGSSGHVDGLQRQDQLVFAGFEPHACDPVGAVDRHAIQQGGRHEPRAPRD